MVEKETKEVKEPKAMFEVVEVATQTESLIKDNSTGETINIFQAIVKILNELQQLKKALI